jgi:hypothetical protein
MAVEQWNNFTDYVIGDEVQNGSSTKYGCILGNINQEPPNATYWSVLNPPSGGGIVSLQALTSADNGGNLVLASKNDSVNFSVDAPTGNIDLAVNFPTALVVDSLNSVTGAVSLLDGGNVTITPDVGAKTITLSVPSIPTTVTSLNGLQNTIGLVNGGNVTITPNAGSGTITLSVPSNPTTVLSLNGCQNVVSLVNGGNITITPDVGAGTITLTVPDSALSVTSLNGCQNVVSLVGSAGVTITPDTGAGTITLDVPSTPLTQYGRYSEAGVDALGNYTVVFPYPYESGEAYEVVVTATSNINEPIFFSVYDRTSSDCNVKWNAFNVVAPATIDISFSWVVVGNRPPP